MIVSLMGDELGSATDIDRLLASSGLSTPIFALIGNDDFWSCHTDFRPKMSPKIGNFEFYYTYLNINSPPASLER